MDYFDWIKQTFLYKFFLLFFLYNLFAVDFINPKLTVPKRTLIWATHTQTEE